jgi:tyrosyl-tRNA synthetase
MDLDKRLELVKAPPTEEVITERELKVLLETNDHPEHYIGFEISGYLHLGTLLMCGFKVNDLSEAGFKTKIYLADWHSFINNKLGGNWDNIIRASRYYAEAFKFFCPKAEVVLGSNLYRDNDEYWRDVMRFSKHITLTRDKRCLTIMGRSEGEKLDLAQYFYPPMQAVDVRYLGKDMPQGGMDQRKVHVLAREVFPKLGWNKPIPLHNHLLMGLAEPPKASKDTKMEKVIAAKMSKSKPWTAIFIHDTEEEIAQKLLKAWCPMKQAEFNPVLELARYVVFHERKEFLLERSAKYGGPAIFSSYRDLEKEYVSGRIHPLDLKLSIAREISKIIDPIRRHFETPSLRRLLEVFKQSEITR